MEAGNARSAQQSILQNENVMNANVVGVLSASNIYTICVNMKILKGNEKQLKSITKGAERIKLPRRKPMRTLKQTNA